MIEFKYTRLDIPGLITPGSKIPIEFIFDGDPNLISKVSPSCGCTADPKVQGNKVVAIFTEQDAKNQNKAHYPTGIYKFNKIINVFLKDQTTIKLTFSGNVLL
jgi:hypothetical protein